MSSNKPIDQINQFKGIFFNGNTEKEFYEHGAHFSHDELVSRLFKLQQEQREVKQNNITQLFKINSINYKRPPKKTLPSNYEGALSRASASASASTRNKYTSTPKNISTVNIINNNNINFTNFNVNVNVNLYHSEIDSSINKIKGKNKDKDKDKDKAKDNGRNMSSSLSSREKKLNWSISQPFQINYRNYNGNASNLKSKSKVVFKGKTPFKNPTRNTRDNNSNSNNGNQHHSNTSSNHKNCTLNAYYNKHHHHHINNAKTTMTVNINSMGNANCAPLGHKGFMYKNLTLYNAIQKIKGKGKFK